jgi:hypothetical protein
MKKLLIIFFTCTTITGYAPPPTIAPPAPNHWELWTMALIQVESGGKDNALGTKSDTGCLQITPILVKEVNRLQSDRRYTMNDALNRKRSIEMYNIIQGYYNPEKDLHLALKIWNPKAPLSYHKKVQAEYEKLLDNPYTTKPPPKW